MLRAPRVKVSFQGLSQSPKQSLVERYILLILYTIFYVSST